MAPHPVARRRQPGLDRGHARGKRVARLRIARGDDARRPQHVRSDARWIAREEVVQAGQRIAAVRMEQGERTLAALARIGVAGKKFGAGWGALGQNGHGCVTFCTSNGHAV